MAELDPKKPKSLSDLVTRMNSGGMVEEFSKTARSYIEERSTVPSYFQSPMRENALAAKEKIYGPFKQLSAEKIASILAYTDEKSKIFEKINTFLRVGEYFGEDVEEIKSFVENLKKALKELSAANDNEEIELNRVVSGEYAENLANLKPGDIIEEKGFGSWAGGEYNAPRGDQFIRKDKFNIVLRTRSKKAINIAPISKYEREQEHLTYPGHKYEIEEIIPDAVYSRKVLSSLAVIKLRQFLFGGLVDSNTGTRITGAEPDTQLIAAQPGEIVINKKTVDAVGASYFLDLNKKYGGPNANKPKKANGSLSIQRFNTGGEVSEPGENKELTEAQRKEKAKDLIARMEKGFDENLLMTLIETIQNPEKEKKQSKAKSEPKKKKFVVIRVKDTPQGESLAQYLGSKVAESFSMAAQARKIDKTKKPKGFYLKKALRFQFGGDFIERTRGTFSQDPASTQDPALSKSQRFSATVAPFIPAEPEEPVKENPSDDNLTKAFNQLSAKFDQLINRKNKKAEQLNLSIDIQQQTVEDSKEVIKENNVLIKISNEIKKKFLRFNKDQEDTEKKREIENAGEETLDLSGLDKVDNKRDDEDEDEEDDDDIDTRRKGKTTNPVLDFFGDALDFAGGRDLERPTGRRRGARRRRFMQKNPLGKRIKPAKNIGSKILSGTLGKLAPKVGAKSATKLGAKAVGKGLLKKVPGVGLIAGVAFGLDRIINDGDWVGGLAEMASGAASTVPGVGTAVSTAIDVGLAAKDVTTPRKMASGGVMAGEAGPESFFSLSSNVGRNVLGNVSSVNNQSLSALPFIIGITKKVIDTSGSVAGDIKPYLNQELGPLERLFGSSNFAVRTIVGKGIDRVKSLGQKIGINQLFSGEEAFSMTESQETMLGAASSSVPVTGIPLGESETAQASQLLSGLVQRGFTKEESAAIVGNLWAESGFRTGATNPTSGAYGLMQWLGGRKDRLIQFAQEKGQPVTDVNLQLDYIAWELRGGNAYESAQFQKAMAYGPTIADKTRGFAYEVERASAGELSSSMPKRVGAAESAFNSAGTAPPPSPAPLAAPPAASVAAEQQTMTPGPMALTTPPVTPAAPPYNPISPPSQNQQAPMPAMVQIAQASGTTIQPVYIMGTNQVAGYRGTKPGFEGRTTTTYYDRSGWQVSSLDQMHRVRLQNN